MTKSSYLPLISFITIMGSLLYIIASCSSRKESPIPIAKDKITIVHLKPGSIVTVVPVANGVNVVYMPEDVLP